MNENSELENNGTRGAMQQKVITTLFEVIRYCEFHNLKNVEIMIVEQETPWTSKSVKKSPEKFKKLETENEENKGFTRPKNCIKTVHVRVNMAL